MQTVDDDDVVRIVSLDAAPNQLLCSIITQPCTIDRHEEPRIGAGGSSYKSAQVQIDSKLPPGRLLTLDNFSATTPCEIKKRKNKAKENKRKRALREKSKEERKLILQAARDKRAAKRRLRLAPFASPSTSTTSSLASPPPPPASSSSSSASQPAQSTETERKLCWASCLSLNNLWKEYATSSVFAPSAASTSQIAQRLYRADLHGAMIKVTCSPNPTLVGLSGIVIQELTHVFRLITPASKIKTVPKRDTIFELQHGTYLVHLAGSGFQVRPAMRSKK